MYLKSCSTLLLLALVACQAAPSPKIINAENNLTNEKLTVEEAGVEKDRAKKAATTFCVQITSDGKEEPVPCDKLSYQPIAPQPIHIVPIQVPQVPPQSIHVIPQPQPNVLVPPQPSYILPPQPAPLPPAPLPPAPQPAPLQPSYPAPQPAPRPTPRPAPQPPSQSTPKPAPQPAPQPTPQPAPIRIVDVPHPSPQPAPAPQAPIINIIKSPASAPCPPPVRTPDQVDDSRKKLPSLRIPSPVIIPSHRPVQLPLPVAYPAQVQPERPRPTVYYPATYPLDEPLYLEYPTPVESSDLECRCAKLRQEDNAYRVPPYVGHGNPMTRDVVKGGILTSLADELLSSKHHHKHHHHRHKHSEDTSLEKTPSEQSPKSLSKEPYATPSTDPTQVVILQFPAVNQSGYPLEYPIDFSNYQYAAVPSTYDPSVNSYSQNPYVLPFNSYPAITHIGPLYHNRNLNELVGQSKPSSEEKPTAFEAHDLSTSGKQVIEQEENRTKKDDNIKHV